MFLVIEGPDCAGKTAVGTALRGIPGVAVIETPPSPFGEIKADVLTKCVPAARLLYFLAGNVHAGAIAAQANSAVVAVRYVWSTLAYHMAIYGTPLEELAHVVEVVRREIPLPDLVVYLDVDRENQLLRVKGRPDDVLQTELMSSAQFQENLRKAYAAAKEMLPARWMEIDTSRLSETQVVEHVARLLT